MEEIKWSQEMMYVARNERGHIVRVEENLPSDYVEEKPAGTAAGEGGDDAED